MTSLRLAGRWLWTYDTLGRTVNLYDQSLHQRVPQFRDVLGRVR